MTGSGKWRRVKAKAVKAARRAKVIRTIREAKKRNEAAVAHEAYRRGFCSTEAPGEPGG